MASSGNIMLRPCLASATMTGPCLWFLAGHTGRCRQWLDANTAQCRRCRCMQMYALMKWFVLLNDDRAEAWRCYTYCVYILHLNFAYSGMIDGGWSQVDNSVKQNLLRTITEYWMYMCTHLLYDIFHCILVHISKTLLPHSTPCRKGLSSYLLVWSTK